MYIVPWVILPITLFFWLQILSPVVPQAAQFLQLLDDGDVRAAFAFIVVDALGSIGLIWYFLKRYGANVSDLGLRKFNPIRAVFEIAATIIVFLIAATAIIWLVSELVPSFNPDEVQENEFTGAGPQFQLYSLFALVILPPLIEEVVFRGFIFPAFAKRWGIWVGAFLSSFLFGLAHLQANVGIYTLVLGLLLCIMYVRFGSIIPGMILHMVNNYLAYMALG